MRPCLQKPNQKNTKGTKTRNSIFVCFATFLYFKFLLLLYVCMAMVGGDICVCHGAYAEVRGQLWNQFSPFSFACVLGIKCRSSGLHSKHLCPPFPCPVPLLCETWSLGSTGWPQSAVSAFGLLGPRLYTITAS